MTPNQEFKEGVSAILGSKKRAEWKHKSVQEVSEEDLEYFYNYPLSTPFEMFNSVDH